MKTKKIFTILTLAFLQVFYAQEVKKEITDEKTNGIKDSIQSIVIEKQNINEKTKPSTPDSAIIAASIAEQKAKKEAEKLLKEDQKAKKQVEDRQNEIAKNQKKLEKQQDRIEKEQKEQIKKQISINDIEEDISKATNNLKDAQKDLIKEVEKHNKKIEKGKFSLVDIEKYEKNKVKQDKKIEDMKAKIVKAESKLRKAKK
jgi:DNA repair exonuclease SbcCD ATPase subunit